jgi:hypothetical protein
LSEATRDTILLTFDVMSGALVGRTDLAAVTGQHCNPSRQPCRAQVLPAAGGLLVRFEHYPENTPNTVYTVVNVVDGAAFSPVG